MNTRGIPTTQQDSGGGGGGGTAARSPFPQHNSPMGSPMPNGGGGFNVQSPSLPQIQQSNSMTMSSKQDEFDLDFL